MALVPAILYSEEIKTEMEKLYYSKDMFYYVGGMGSWPADIPEDNDPSVFKWASVDQEGELVGYIAYQVNWYNGNAYNFGLFSFRKGDLTLPADLDYVMNDLLNNPAIHRVEWCGVSGNPVIRSYTRFCKKHGGYIHTLHDVVRDDHGQYHNSIIFEIIKGENDGRGKEEKKNV